MTVIQPNSISGVTSITAHGGDITYYKSDGTAGNQFTHNIQSTGVITATKFVGAFDGTTGTFSGNLGVGGVLTYEDVTNIDSVGVITARSGIRIGATGANTLIQGTATGIALGTGTPRQKLHINASDSGASNIVFTNATTGTAAGDGFVIGITGGEDAQLNMQESANIKFSTADTERLRITSAGKLGVGVASPVSILHLHEAGSSGAPIIQFSNGDTGTTTGDGFAIGMADNESPFIYNRENTDLRIATNNTERLRIGSSGQIGIAGANYGAARQVIVSNGSGSAVSWSSNPFLLDMDGLGDIDYDSVFLRYRETAAITGNGLVHLGLCKSTTNCGPGRIGIPVGFIPGTAYNAHFRVDKVGITPWPDGSGHRYEFYAIISDYVSTGKLGIFYLTNSTN